MKIDKRTIKIISLAALCFTAALTFALIPVNIFCANFPEWLTVLFSVLFCGGLIAYLIFFKTKLVTKIVLPVIFGIVALLSSFVPYLVPYWNSYTFKSYNGKILNYDEVVSYKAAESDLNALKHYLAKVHPMFKDGLTEEVENLFVRAKENLKSADEITVNGFRREIQTVLHAMGDAHTTTYNSYPNDKYLKAFPEKTYNGYSVASINGKTVKQIFEDAKPYYCYETEDWISIDLGSIANLEFLGYNAPFTYEWTDGESVKTEMYTEADFVSWEEFLVIRNEYVTPSEPKDFVFYKIDEQNSMAVLTLTECNYNQTYIDCVEAMFTEVKQKNIQNVAVDLRGNGGGSSQVGNEFVKYLPVENYYDGPFDWRFGFLNLHSDGKTTNYQYTNLTFDGNVFILTDNGSFSAAKDFAMLIQDNHLGKIVGESPANSVSGYGEVAYFYLPNTGLFVQISTKKWYRIDQTNTEDYVIPDYRCDSNDCFDKLYEIIG
ncbi:MAG: hypothetical protein HDP34_05740 [Clostridia bacterium]|nr:hypothetical protein [Clostridia bacterium]